MLVGPNDLVELLSLKILPDRTRLKVTIVSKNRLVLIMNSVHGQLAFHVFNIQRQDIRRDGKVNLGWVAKFHLVLHWCWQLAMGHLVYSV